MYAVPTDTGWRRLTWPALKISNGTPVRPGEAGVTSELLAAVGAVQVVDPGPVLDPATQVVASRTLTDADGTPTVAYVIRDKTADELAADQQAAQDETEREQAKQAVTKLREYIDNPTPTALETVPVVKLLCRIAIRLIRDQYGR